jgi:hypothetical protein
MDKVDRAMNQPEERQKEVVTERFLEKAGLVVNSGMSLARKAKKQFN